MFIGTSLGVVGRRGGEPTDLILPGWLDPRRTFTRAQVAAVPTIQRADGSWRSDLTADQPRWHLDEWLWLEGLRTNLLANARTLTSGTVTVTAVAHALSFFGTGSVTLSGAATATISGTGASNRVEHRFTPSAGTLTFTVSGSVTWAQLEVGAFASTPVLPPVGSPASATRNADLLSWLLASLGIAPNGACTIWGEFLIPQTAVSANQTILQIDSGSDANRYILRNDAGQSSCKLYRVTGGVGGGGSPAGTFTAGSPFRIGVSCDGAGRGAVSMNGGAIVAATGGPTSGLSAFRLGGSNVGTAENLFGGCRKLRVLPYGAPDAALQALTASL